MKLSKSQVTSSVSKKRRTIRCTPLSTLALLCAAVFIGSTYFVTDFNEKFSVMGMLDSILRTGFKKVEDICRPTVRWALPRGIISNTSNLEMRPLWGKSTKKVSKNLLAMAVGIKHSESVDKIVKKFIRSNFIVMLFHYDGNVDEWGDFAWNSRVLHIAASNQTKWWFAKRFLHPDIVSEYTYIFLWDEHHRVENFNVQRYLSVIKHTELEISQPTLDLDESEIDHELKARRTRWVEMLAPVFSRKAWRCAWYLIQNDLVQAWNVDFQLSYCAQGDTTKKIGIVDSDYVVHFGLPTLDGEARKKGTLTSSNPDHRNTVRKQSLTDAEKFGNRYRKSSRG